MDIIKNTNMGGIIAHAVIQYHPDSAATQHFPKIIFRRS